MIVSLPPASTMLRGQLVTPQPQAFLPKDPADIALLEADFALLLSADAAIIQLDTAVTPPDAVTIVSATWSGTVCALLAMGGADGIPALILLTVTLSTGGRVSRAVILPILAQLPVPLSSVPADALTLNGLPLTIGGEVVEVQTPDQPLTIDQSPLSVGGIPIDLGA